MSLDLHREAIKEKIKGNYRIYQPKMVMYSFRIDREILEGTKKEVAQLSISAAAFITLFPHVSGTISPPTISAHKVSRSQVIPSVFLS